jgi:hypothetical protein
LYVCSVVVTANGSGTSSVWKKQKFSGYKWKESTELDFMDTFNDGSSALCVCGVRALLQRDEVNNAVNVGKYKYCVCGYQGWS